MSFTPDQVTFYDNAAIQYPELHRKILEMATNAMILGKLFIPDYIMNGRTRTYVKENGDISVGINPQSVGAPAAMDYTPLTQVAVTPDKYGEQIEIPVEMITDLELSVVDQQMKRLAFKTMYQLEKMCLTVIDAAGVAAGTSFALTGKTISLTGTEITISGGIGLEDLNKADRLIAQKNFIARYIVMNPIQKESLRNLPYPNLYRTVENPLTHEVEEKLGIWTIMTSNLITAGTVYMISDGQNPNNNYAPMGFMVTKQEITTNIDTELRRGVIIPYTVFRKVPYVTNAYCIVKMTGGSTS